MYSCIICFLGSVCYWKHWIWQELFIGENNGEFENNGL